MRTIASLSAYIATHTATAVQIHQFIDSDLHFEIDGGAVKLAQRTRYPLDGIVTFLIHASPSVEWTLQIRQPDWATAIHMKVNGHSVESTITENGYVAVTRTWSRGDTVEYVLPMVARLTVAHPAVDAVRGAVAIERGPVVYAFESPDQEDGIDLNSVELLTDQAIKEIVIENFLGRPTILLEVTALARDDASWGDQPWKQRGNEPPTVGRRVQLTAIPYAFWANRGPSIMRIFIPASPADSSPSRSARG